jgi:dienelactone hydrolase
MNEMKQIHVFVLLATLVFAKAASAEPTRNTSHVVDIKSADGTILKASYFASPKPGPGVLLFHQSNRTRKSWNDVARQLANAGINTLAVDMRGHGETGGKYDNWNDPNREQAKQQWQADIDAAFQYLISQSGVNRDVIGLGGAGVLGVDNSVQTARRHPDQIKSLVLLSGETFRDGLEFLRQASGLPELFVVSDNDEYPPTRQAMELLYVMASSPSKKFVHYSDMHDAPWRWYEPVDVDKVPATGGHGTDLFEHYRELPATIVDWFVTTLLKTPGHAPAESIAAADTINRLETPGGAEQITQQLIEARKADPQAQLFPEITAGIVGADYMRAGDLKSAIEVMKLVLLAYPDSADANDNLAFAYLKDGQRDLARQHAEKALAILDAHKGPASSWTNTQEYRGEIRRDVQKTLKKLSDKQG